MGIEPWVVVSEKDSEEILVNGRRPDQTEKCQQA